MKNTDLSGLALRVSKNTLIGNILLSAFKLFAGVFAHSSAMVSDAVHSLSDVLADIIVLVGMKMSSQKADKEHPYGHERFECVAGILLAFILFTVGILIGYDGVKKIFSSGFNTIAAPGLLALIAAIVSIVVKESMYWYTRAAANKVNSVALKASAWHHRSDAFSSVGSFAGILGARLGLPILDAVACVVICVFILKVSVDIFKEAIDKMTDRACSDDVIYEIKSAVLENEQVAGIDDIRTRLFGSKIYLDVEISIDGEASLTEAHGIAEHVHDLIEERFPGVKHCMVHVNPSNSEQVLGG